MQGVISRSPASSKFRQTPDEVKILSNLHVPAPATAELLVGVFETIGVIALVFGVYARLAAIFLAIFMVVVSFAVLSFWSPADPPPVRTQKLNGFVANIAIVGGLIYVVVVGPGRFSFAQ
jgi:putative oxidoreductase